MTQSVELLLEAELDAAVRREWLLLSDAGLPSQARHEGESNAPHVTIGVASEASDAAERGLGQVVSPAGTELRLGGLLVFTGRGAVLSRAVVPTASLLEAHRQTQAAWRDQPGVPDTMRPGRWTPHVTLARRLDAAQLASALEILADAPRELVGTIAGLRRWDSDVRRTWLLG